MLEQYAPPSVVVNGEYDIVHMSEKAGKYLELQGGEPTQNLLKLVRHELRLELRSVERSPGGALFCGYRVGPGTV